MKEWKKSERGQGAKIYVREGVKEDIKVKKEMREDRNEPGNRKSEGGGEKDHE